MPPPEPWCGYWTDAVFHNVPPDSLLESLLDPSLPIQRDSPPISTAPQCPHNVEETCQPRQPHDLIHPRSPATVELFNYLGDLSSIYGQAHPQSTDSASSVENVLVGLRRSKHSLHCLLTSPVKVISIPSSLYTVLMKDCSPLHSMVCQNLLGTTWKLLSMASLSSTHTQVFASVTAEAAVCWYLLVASGVLQTKQALWNSFFSLRASLNHGIQHWVWAQHKLLPLQALTTS